MLRFRPSAQHAATSLITARKDRIELAECDREHEVNAPHLVPLLNSYFYHCVNTILGGRGFESDELHESVGAFGAVATRLQSDQS